MTTNFQFAQAPNRKGNISKDPAKLSGGVTAVTGTKHGVATPKGSQGAPAATGKVNGRGQKVMLSTPECYDKTPRNDAYLDADRTNYLK